MPQRTPHTNPWLARGGRSAVALGVILTAGCGGVAAIASTATVHQRYKTTPASTGAVDLHAVPLGDGYVSTSPKVGYVNSCQTSFGTGGGGAFKDGPWLNTAAKTWDYAGKLSVAGSVKWSGASYAVSTSGGKRQIKFNDLPTTHTTGTFPIASSDPAYAYDRNPNRIAAQSFSWSLPAKPTAASKPSCVNMGVIGVLTDGVALENALDGEGRDAAAHEVLDQCAGHPDQSSTYHHHDVPACILKRTAKGKSTLVGYALDGYGIYVTKDASGKLPTNSDLDACHGTTSKVKFDGKVQRIYHYVATYEYPYTVGCYHGTPVSSGRSGGGGGGSQQGGSGQPGGQGGPPNGGPPPGGGGGPR